MLKVAQILYSGLGGHASVVFSIINADKQRQLCNHLIFYGIEETKPEYIEKCEQLKIPYTSIIKKSTKDNINPYLKLFNSLKTIKPDIILCHSPNVIIPSYLYKKINSTKLIIVEHTPNQVKRKSEWLWSLLSMIVANKVVLLSEQYRVDLKKKLGFIFRSSKVKVIPNGIDIDVFAPSLKRQNWKGVSIGMVSRLSVSKDHNALIKAFVKLKGKPYYDSLNLYIAGDGETRDSLIKITEELDLKSKVHFLGMLDEQQIIDLLNDLDIYVHSSLGETMSTAIMQAMACGLPVIATDIPGINNLIEHEKTGLLFTKGDDNELQSYIDSLVLNLELRRKLMESAREYAINYFSNKIMFSKYSKLING